jgi:hypothetical protein
MAWWSAGWVSPKGGEGPGRWGPGAMERWIVWALDRWGAGALGPYRFSSYRHMLTAEARLSDSMPP